MRIRDLDAFGLDHVDIAFADQLVGLMQGLDYIPEAPESLCAVDCMSCCHADHLTSDHVRRFCIHSAGPRVQPDT